MAGIIPLTAVLELPAPYLWSTAPIESQVVLSVRLEIAFAKVIDGDRPLASGAPPPIVAIENFEVAREQYVTSELIERNPSGP